MYIYVYIYIQIYMYELLLQELPPAFIRQITGQNNLNPSDEARLCLNPSG
jgi:hypothetical protein